MRQLVLIAHNLRSAHNVGSLLRTADGLGVNEVILSGYTPYPIAVSDHRSPHEAAKTTARIHKTALGAETSQNWRHSANIMIDINDLLKRGFTVAALEQQPDSVKLPDFKPPARLAIVVGREVEGLEPEILERCDPILEIPMFGAKESFNVVQAAAMALYHCCFWP